MNGRVTLVLDENVPIFQAIAALASIGLRVSNIDGFTFRVERGPWEPKVVKILRGRRARQIHRSEPPASGA